MVRSALLVALLLSLSGVCLCQRQVRSYVKKNGTYVQPAHRTSPDLLATGEHQLLFDSAYLELDRGEEFGGNFDEALDVILKTVDARRVVTLRCVVQIADLFGRRGVKALR